jgi:hypothetical protein
MTRQKITRQKKKPKPKPARTSPARTPAPAIATPAPIKETPPATTLPAPIAALLRWKPPATFGETKTEAKEMSVNLQNLKLYSCWGCDRFSYDDPEKKLSGECHRDPPVIVPGNGGTSEWPPIADGTDARAWCGAFFPATHKVPKIPTFPE